MSFSRDPRGKRADRAVETLQQRPGFARVQLRGGGTIAGWVGRDPECGDRLRLDGLAEEDDGSLTPFSLSLDAQDIETVELLAEAPAVIRPGGSRAIIPAGFWPDDD